MMKFCKYIALLVLAGWAMAFVAWLVTSGDPILIGIGVLFLVAYILFSEKPQESN